MRKLLLPLNLVFRTGVFFRNKLYSYRILRQTEIDSYIISVGNISAGGTGKTPFTEYLSKYLFSKGKFVIIVCKGYKRTSEEIQVCEIGYKATGSELTVETFGDEALMLLNNLGEFQQNNPEINGLLVVSDDKTKGAKFAYKKFHPDVIIVDDAFQHRKLYRDLDIVLISNSRQRLLLPAGNLREPFRNIRRADIVILNKKFSDKREPLEKKQPAAPVCVYINKGFYDAEGRKTEVKDMRAAVFCGIAEPDSFRILLEKENLQVKKMLDFPDHDNFNEKDIEKIIKAYKDSKAECLITTQKDFIRLKYTFNTKLRDIYKKLFELPLYYPKIEIKMISNEDILKERINKALNIYDSNNKV